MSDLHPLYELGGWLRGALVVLGVSAGAYVRWSRRLRAVRERARQARGQLPEAEPLDAARLVAGREVTFDGRFTENSVRTVDVDVSVRGKPTVVAGSHESPSGKKVVRRLRDGARVRVRGVLERSDPKGYRDHQAAWSMTDPVIAALDDPELLGWPWTASVGGLGGGLLVLLVLAVVGVVCVLPANSADVIDDGQDLSMLAVGAVTPMRAHALDTEGRVLVATANAPAETGDPGELLARAVRLFELAGDSAAASDLRGRLCVAKPAIPTLEEAPHRYLGCGQPVPADVYFGMGAFDEASQASDDARSTDRDHLLRMTEAHLVMHRYDRAAEALSKYAAHLGDSNPDRREVLDCLGKALSSKQTGAPMRTADMRAACRVLDADTHPISERAQILGDGGFVWSDAQGMEFAKLLVNRISQALLIEAGSTEISPEVLKYALYPDAYIESHRPAHEVWEMKHFDLGNDVAHMEWYERTHLEEHPYAIWNAIANAPEHRGDPDEVRFHAAAHVGLLLAVAGERERANAIVESVKDVASVQLGFWTRPSQDDVRTNVVRLLEGERPYRFRGALFGAFTETLDRSIAHTPTARAARGELASFTKALLDRDICVPLLLLEAFARRGS